MLLDAAAPSPAAAGAEGSSPGGPGRSAPARAVQPIRIVHVCRQYRPGIGGLESVIHALATRQQAAGLDVSVVTLDRLFSSRARPLPRRETIDGVPVERIPFFGSRRYPFALGVLRHLAGASLVHVHGIDFFFDFLAWTRPIHRRTMVATTHGGFFHTSFASALKRAWFGTVTRRSARRYAALVACSRQDEERFSRISAPDRIVPIDNGVDLARFARVADRTQDRMLYFGRFAANKGLGPLLAWFAAVRAIAPQWRLTIAGQPDGMTVTDLLDLIAAYGLDGAVEVLEAPSEADLAQLIRRASVFVSASWFEGFGLAPIEAAAAGLFPVLRRIPPFEATVDRLALGCLTEFEASAEAIRPVLDAIERWRRQPAEPRLDGFGWDVAAGRYMRLYQQCLGIGSRRIGAVDVTVTDADELVGRFNRHVRERRPLTIAFCNAHTVNMARRNARMAAAMRSALVVNDGIGVDIASRLLFGKAFPKNLNGTDLTPAILHRSAVPLRIFLVGGEPGVAAEAAGVLARDHPRHRFVGAQHGFFNDAEEGAVLARIRAARPDLVLLGMGHPRQEIWAAEHAADLPCVTMCVGAFIDFAAGRVSRAPAWMRKARCEWIYRLSREPRRLAARYLVGNVDFLIGVLRQRRTGVAGAV